MPALELGEQSVVLVAGMPDAGKLRVHRRDGRPARMGDVRGGAALLYSLPQLPAEWAEALTAACLPEGVSVHERPPPPSFFTTTLSQPDGPPLHLACLHIYEPLPPSLVAVVLGALSTRGEATRHVSSSIGVA